MTNLFNKLGTALSNTVMFAAAVIMAGLGFAVMGTLAVFAVLAIGIALIAAPFAMQPQTPATDEDAAA